MPGFLCHPDRLPMSFLTLCALVLVPIPLQEVAPRERPTTRDDASWEILEPRVVESIETAFVRSEIVVGMEPSTGRADLIGALAEEGLDLRGEIPSLRALKLRLMEEEDESAALARVRSMPGVAYAHLNHVGQGAGAARTPGDTHLGQQWHLENEGQTGGTPGADINLTEAWEIERGRPTVTLAVLDSGIDFGHPEFEGRLLQGYDFVREDADPTTIDLHGIHAAGLAMANADNGFGVAGVDQGCKLLPVRVLTNQGLGTLFDLAQGIDYAAEMGADVISMSLIGFPADPLLEAALSRARAAGCILIACAGNAGLLNANRSYPGASPLTIAVGASDHDDARAYFSGTGNRLDFLAPGVDVPTVSGSHADTFDLFTGCSAATPIVAGVVSLLKARHPDLDQDCAYELLRAGARDRVGPASEDTVGYDTFFGHGRIDAGASLRAPYPCRPRARLGADVRTVDLVRGGQQRLRVDAGPDFAGAPYLALGSLSGPSPGLNLGGSWQLPLNPDSYFEWTRSQPGSKVLENSLGTLDTEGRADITVNVPENLPPSLAGLRLDHAVVVVDLERAAVGSVTGNLPLTLALPQVLLEEDFEDDAPTWNFNGLSTSFENLWHVTAAGDCGASSRMAAFDNGPLRCDYTTEDTAIGWLESHEFVLTGQPPFRISFDSVRQITLGGENRTVVSLFSRSPDFVSQDLATNLDFDNTGNPEHIELEVSDPWLWAGRTVRVQFQFWSTTPEDAAGLGWKIDDVRMTSGVDG